MPITFICQIFVQFVDADMDVYPRVVGNRHHLTTKRCDEYLIYVTRVILQDVGWSRT